MTPSGGHDARFAGKAGLGLRLTHTSNASLAESDPGRESAFVVVSVPLGKRPPR